VVHPPPSSYHLDMINSYKNPSEGQSQFGKWKFLHFKQYLKRNSCFGSIHT
jgi:hypothetical protein